MNLIKKYYQWRLGKVEKHIEETKREMEYKSNMFKVINNYAKAGLYSHDFTGAEYHKDKGDAEKTIADLNRDVNSLDNKRKSLISKLNSINKNGSN